MKVFKLAIAGLFIVASIVAAIVLSKVIEKKTYKLSYPENIQENAEKYELDPYLVAAIIHVESGNREGAISEKGAIGLMQIMPLTGEWIAEKLKVDFKTEDLKTPEVNIEFGCWYLRFLKDRFSNEQTVMAAYNAGHNAVAKWIKDPQLSTDNESLTDIPFSQTKIYVEKVTRAYEKFKTLYPQAFELQ